MHVPRSLKRSIGYNLPVGGVVMIKELIANRLYELRQFKGLSARDMSLSLGFNPNYINHIENGKTLPSMQAFIYICEYLEVSPQEFFDIENSCPECTRELVENLKKLDAVSLVHISEIIKRLTKK